MNMIGEGFDGWQTKLTSDEKVNEVRRVYFCFVYEVFTRIS